MGQVALRQVTQRGAQLLHGRTHEAACGHHQYHRQQCQRHQHTQPGEHAAGLAHHFRLRRFGHYGPVPGLVALHRDITRGGVTAATAARRPARFKIAGLLYTRQ